MAATPVSARYGAFLELLHTEENYVGILDTLLQVRTPVRGLSLDQLTPLPVHWL